MKEITCVVVGGGYAGIHAVKAIRDKLSGRSIRLILLDKEPHHLRKVLLFKPAVSKEAAIELPLKSIFPDEVEFVQGTATKIEKNNKTLFYQDQQSSTQAIHYDMLVLAIGSVIRQAEPEQGGIALSSVEAAETIRETWLANMQKAVRETNPEERQRLLTVTIAGAGISGIETAAELAYAMHEEAARLGISPAETKVYLINTHNRLFPEGSAKLGRKLEQTLTADGVTILHRQKVVAERDGIVTLSSGHTFSTGLCIWSLGLIANPLLRTIGIPISAQGQVIVDASYRVSGAPGVYSIGDCARIIDPVSGQADRMTCKEGTAQAARLGSVLAADLDGTSSPTHKSFMEFFCIGLGPEKGIVWTRKWGLDIILTGKLGWKIRQYTWNVASMLH
ncbi:NAD(P)/FAD-dependent oxidoreductase [Brevibacillus reuszeri]|uniref:NAD(P)/FAD-dependent oxidoreductase n=1 Tax=Brevibacillus reuszeri TaxID=54915 RepID=UPI003D251D39